MNNDGNEWELIEPGVGTVLAGLWGKTEYKEKYACKSVNSAEGLAE